LVRTSALLRRAGLLMLSAGRQRLTRRGLSAHPDFFCWWRQQLRERHRTSFARSKAISNSQPMRLLEVGVFVEPGEEVSQISIDVAEWLQRFGASRVLIARMGGGSPQRQASAPAARLR